MTNLTKYYDMLTKGAMKKTSGTFSFQDGPFRTSHFSCSGFRKCSKINFFENKIIFYPMTPNYTSDILSYYTGYWNKGLEPWSSSVVYWCKDDCASIYMLCKCFMGVIWEDGSYLTWMDHPTDNSMTSNYSPDILSCYPGYWNQDLEPWSLSVV